MLDSILRSEALFEASEGEMNYAITRLILAWLGSKIQYGDYNAAIGVLECVQMELYARRIRPYEDEKCALNGDVY